MRIATVMLLATLGLGLLGCSSPVEMRPEPVEVKGTVKLPGGASPKDLAITLQPQQNSQPGGGKLDASGSFTTKIAPGKYIAYFDESNSKHAAYKSIPEKYRSPAEENSITIDGQPITITVK
ncbi:MAG: hypothetical protein C0467_28335 [Planctomycetaceae bacterium]|nr:hypothetical protein [Planctomycetaceae bacterium]